MKKITLLKPIFAVGDFIILGGSVLLAYHLRFMLPFLPDRPVPPFDLYFQFSFLFAFIGFGLLYSSRMYQLRSFGFGVEDFLGVFRAVTFTSLSVMAVSFAFRGFITRYDWETHSRLVILISWGLSLLTLTLWRSGLSALIQMMQKRGRGLKKVIIVGTDQVGKGFLKAVQENVDFGYLPVGFVYNGLSPTKDRIEGLKVLGGVEHLQEILRTRQVDDVVLASMNLESETVARLIKICERADVQFSLIPGFFEILTHQMNVQEIADILIFQLEERIFKRWGRLVKRGIDIGVTLCVLTVISPLLALIALAIKLESFGPILFRQARVGKGEKIFSMYKFRSMHVDAESKRQVVESLDETADPLLRVSEDPRVTRFGQFLRRFSMDEFPNMINVLKGEMSWVGPRPHMPSEVAGYKTWHRRKYDVLPGITGLTQVSGRKNLSLDEMVRLDLYYIENWSPLLDLKIMLKTIPVALSGRGAY